MVWNAVKRQLRSVIQWEPTEASLFEAWTDNGDEIKNASKLIIKPGQGCIFLYQGKVEAIWDKPGLYELKTDNIPFWTTVTKFMQAFQSEHKVGIHFFRTAEVVNLKWGTPKGVKYEDPKYKFPIVLKAYGTFSARITDPGSYMANIVMSRSLYTTEEFKEFLMGRIPAPIQDFLAESKFGYEDIDSNLNELSDGIKVALVEVFKTVGFEITDFRIIGTSFDEKTQKRIDDIADASADAQAAAKRGLTWAQQEQLGIMRTAAANEGGGGVAGMGVGLGAGVAMGQAMGGMFGQGMHPMGMPAQGQAPGQAPAAAPAQAAAPAANDPAAKLQKLKSLLDSGLITQAEFDAKKKEILASI